MFVIVGCIVVVACVLGGFSMAGGHFHSLVHPSEIVTIGGASLGALIIMAPKKVLVDLLKGVLGTIKGSPYGKAAYEELFKTMYDLFRTARREGVLALEKHVSNPHESELFKKYKCDHHATTFICDGLSPLVEGTARGDDIGGLLEIELHTMEEEHHAPVDALTKTADGLPGFGIVAAVLGIVVTMGHIDGPPAEIGHKVGAALVGTFLGILASYGFFGPLAGRMHTLGVAELQYFRTIAAMITSFANDLPPKVVIERARRGVASEFRPTRERVEELFSQVESS